VSSRPVREPEARGVAQGGGPPRGGGGPVEDALPEPEARAAGRGSLDQVLTDAALGPAPGTYVHE
jgi:hypothetical protein